MTKPQKSELRFKLSHYLRAEQIVGRKYFGYNLAFRGNALCYVEILMIAQNVPMER